MNSNFHLILASKSPRRKALLESLGLEFTIRSIEVDETIPNEVAPQEAARFLAEKKSGAYTVGENELLITADTTVVLGKEVLNKPASKEEAIGMLTKLSGKAHEVISGVCLKTTDKQVSFSESTRVYFKPLSLQEIEHYVATYQPYDKAGAYGIQEWIGMIGIEKIEGDYYNVMGLPVHQLYTQLSGFGPG